MKLVLSCITRQAVAETVENFRNSPRFHGGAKRLGTNTSEPRLLHPTSSRSQVRATPPPPHLPQESGESHASSTPPPAGVRWEPRLLHPTSSRSQVRATPPPPHLQQESGQAWDPSLDRPSHVTSVRDGRVVSFRLDPEPFKPDESGLWLFAQ